MVVCYGDSITRGVPGVSYLRYMDKKWNARNAGLGGDTVLGLQKRIESQPKNRHVEDLILQIGTNDILLPFLQTHSKRWEKRVLGLIRSGRVPCENKKRFETEYKRLLDQATKKQNVLLVVSIPCIGEYMGRVLNKKVTEYNEIIRHIAKEYEIPYADFFGRQVRLLESKNNEHAFFITKDPYDMIRDVVWSSVLPMSESLRRKRGLSMTVDGCHLSHAGAKLLADVVQQSLHNRQR